MSPSLQGKVCLVTGAARGIGRGIALQLGQAGATVYITGRTRDNLEDCAREIKVEMEKLVVLTDKGSPLLVEDSFFLLAGSLRYKGAYNPFRECTWKPTILMPMAYRHEESMRM